MVSEVTKILMVTLTRVVAVTELYQPVIVKQITVSLTVIDHYNIHIWHLLASTHSLQATDADHLVHLTNPRIITYTLFILDCLKEHGMKKM